MAKVLATVPFARKREFKPEHPERTAYKTGKGFACDVTFQEWPSRGAMLATINMQRKGAGTDKSWWYPCVPEVVARETDEEFRARIAAEIAAEKGEVA